MPASLKVVQFFNVLTAAAILVVAAAIVGGVSSDSVLSYEGHENKLIPIGPNEPAYSRTASQSPTAAKPLRAEIPPEYRSSDAVPSPWVVMADGSVCMFRND